MSQETQLLGLGDLGRRVARRRGALLLSVVVTAGCLWLLHRGALPVVPSDEQLSRAAPWATPAYAFVFALTQFCRGARWRYLLRPLAQLRFREVLAANYVFSAALFILPLRLGEFVRPALLRRPGRLSGWQVVGLVGAERVVDGLFSSVILAAALLLSGVAFRTDLEGPAELVRSTAFVMVAFFGLALGGVLLFFFFQKLARRLLDLTVGLVSKRLAHLMADKIESIAAGLEFLRAPRDGIPFLLTSSLYWFLNVASAWLLMRACGMADASLLHASTMIGVLALGLLVPGAPGFFGTFQLSCYAGLSLYLGADALARDGAVVVFWMYVVQLVVILATGFASLPYSVRLLREAGVSEDAAALD